MQEWKGRQGPAVRREACERNAGVDRHGSIRRVSDGTAARATLCKARLRTSAMVVHGHGWAGEASMGETANGCARHGTAGPRGWDCLGMTFARKGMAGGARRGDGCNGNARPGRRRSSLSARVGKARKDRQAGFVGVRKAPAASATQAGLALGRSVDDRPGSTSQARKRGDGLRRDGLGSAGSAGLGFDRRDVQRQARRRAGARTGTVRSWQAWRGPA